MNKFIPQLRIKVVILRTLSVRNWTRYSISSIRHGNSVRKCKCRVLYFQNDNWKPEDA